MVYKAVHKMSQELRAIKIINKAGVSIENEAKIVSEINILKQMVRFFGITIGSPKHCKAI